MEARIQEIPEEGELVISTVNQITSHGVYVSLDEYGGLRGFLHVSEISTGWVRNIERYVKKGQKVVLKAIRVDKSRREVDLSLRQVSGEERKSKLIQVKRAEKAKGILDLVKARLNLKPDETVKLKDLLSREFGTLYDGLEEVARRGAEALAKLNLPANYSAVLEQVAKEKIVIPSVEVRGVMEISSELPEGVELIRNALIEAESAKADGADVKISYIGAPRYRIIVRAEKYKVAGKVLESAVERAREVVEKGRGVFNFYRGEPKKGGR